MAPPSPEDRLFHERLLRGDDAAWAALQRALEHLVRNRGVRFGFTGEEIEDLQSRIQHKLLEKECLCLRKFDHRCRLIEWVGVVVLNEARDYYRARARAWRREERERALNEVRSELPAHEQLIERLSAAQALEGALASLSPENRMILALRYVQGFSHREIAQLTGISEHAVNSRIHRAREALSGQLEERTESPPVGMRVVRRTP